MAFTVIALSVVGLPARAIEIDFTIDPASRHQSRAFYNSVFIGSQEVPMDWTGSHAGCVPGETSQSYRDSVRASVNYFRAMAGVPANIRFLAEYNNKAQAAALIMSANGGLSHDPPANWSCWSAEGDEAAGNSNLSLGSSGPDAVFGQMQDAGGNNSAVGHRRWVLYPQTQEMGTGDVAGVAPHASANALWVIDSNYWGERPVTREEFVAWPAPGYTPYQLLFPRWSFSYPGADFSTASVTMTRSGEAVPLVLEPLQQGIGESTIVWIPENKDPIAYDSGWSKPVEDTSYHVELQNVLIAGVPMDFSYDVTVFDPGTAAPDEVHPVITGLSTVQAGTIHSFNYKGIPFSQQHQLRVADIQPYSGIEGAENGVVEIIDETDSSYDLLSAGIKMSGVYSFHMVHPEPETQRFTWTPQFLLTESSELNFQSRLGWATEDQVARVEISLDGGANWKELFRRTGSGDGGDGVFSLTTLPLAAYAGQTAQFRFVYALVEQAAVSYFSQTSEGVGFYLDDIQLTHGKKLTDPTTVPLDDANSFQFLFPDTGDYLLQVRAVPWDGFPGLEWGPGFEVNATTLDSDGDGVIDVIDEDDDDDGLPDAYEAAMGFDPLNSEDALRDFDGDGESNLEEYRSGTDPLDPASSLAARRRTVIQIINSILLGME